MADKADEAGESDQIDDAFHEPCGYHPPMDGKLLKACSTGDLNLFRQLILPNSNIQKSITPHGNNCLHIAAMLGHDKFAMEVLSSFPSLLSEINKDGETPLMAALKAANPELASNMLHAAREHLQPDIEAGQLKTMLSRTDKCGDTALHLAIRNRFDNLALRLLCIAPELSEELNMIGESPMCMAARKGCCKIVVRLLEIPDSEDSGPSDFSALHMAIAYGHTC